MENIFIGDKVRFCQQLLRLVAFIHNWKVLDTQWCPTLCDPMDWGPPGFSACEILQARILEWVAIPFSRGSSQPGDWTQVFCVAGRLFTVWTNRVTHDSQLKENVKFQVEVDKKWNIIIFLSQSLERSLSG